MINGIAFITYLYRNGFSNIIHMPIPILGLVMFQCRTPSLYTPTPVQGSFDYNGLTLFPALICNHMPSKVWDENTLPSPNISGCIVEISKWINIFTGSGGVCCRCTRAPANWKSNPEAIIFAQARVHCDNKPWLMIKSKLMYLLGYMICWKVFHGHMTNVYVFNLT